MKKILMIFAAMAAVLSSCSKSEIDTVSNNDGKDMILNISVSNPGADTKALIKTDWTTDDEISIWYDTNTDATPDLVIKYDGTKWIQKTGATVSGNNPAVGDNKYAKALYNGTLKVASKDTYTYENNTLTFNIANWKFLTEVQVVVKDLDKDKAADYTLACDRFTPITGNGYTVGAEAITVATGIEGTPVTGIINTDGVAFVFATADYSTSSTDKKVFTFTLKNNTTGAEKAKGYAPTVAIAATDGKKAIKALKIENNKFAERTVEYVTINGKKWATMNLGATNVNDYGKLYSWGNLNGRSGNNFSPSFTSAIYNNSEGSKINNDSYKWNKEKHDAAYIELGDSWRMPTKDDFIALDIACGGTGENSQPMTAIAASHIDNGKVEKGRYWLAANQAVLSGIDELENITAAGMLYSDGENYLFFPAAGYSGGTSRTNGGSYGRYWSSTWFSSTNPYRMGFNKDNVHPQLNGDLVSYPGFSVRPVSD